MQKCFKHSHPTETECHHWPLWKNWKMTAISLILIIWKNFKFLNPQSLGLWFSECCQKWNITTGHYEKIEKWLPNFEGVSNLKFFHMINIKEMAAIFQFFHNGWWSYSISIDTQKTRDPNFGEVGNLKCFHMINIKEMAAIFQFVHNGQWWYSISIGTRKTRDPNFGGGQEFEIFPYDQY